MYKPVERELWVVAPLGLIGALLATFRRLSLLHLVPMCAAYSTLIWILYRAGTRATAGPGPMFLWLSVAPFAYTSLIVALLDSYGTVSVGVAWVTLVIIVQVIWIHASLSHHVEMMKASISFANGVSSTLLAIAFLLTLNKPFDRFAAEILATFGQLSLSPINWDTVVKLLTLPYMLGGLWAKAILDYRRYQAARV